MILQILLNKVHSKVFPQLYLLNMKWRMVLFHVWWLNSLQNSKFYDETLFRYGHEVNLKILPGSCWLMKALRTCIASVSHDIDVASASFQELTLDNYNSESVDDFSTKALSLSIIQAGCALPVNTSSWLLAKVSKTSLKEFNRKFFAFIESVKSMDYQNKVLDPKKLTKTFFHSSEPTLFA